MANSKVSVFASYISLLFFSNDNGIRLGSEISSWKIQIGLCIDPGQLIAPSRDHEASRAHVHTDLVIIKRITSYRWDGHTTHSNDTRYLLRPHARPNTLFSGGGQSFLSFEITKIRHRERLSCSITNARAYCEVAGRATHEPQGRFVCASCLDSFAFAHCCMWASTPPWEASYGRSTGRPRKAAEREREKRERRKRGRREAKRRGERS